MWFAMHILVFLVHTQIATLAKRGRAIGIAIWLAPTLIRTRHTIANVAE